jgi:cyclopropane fatty-acyl-phospholipid synthase-like methyltransferase
MPTDAVQLYNEIWASERELESFYVNSLGPRSADSLYDLFGSLGVKPADHVIDIGCRNGTQAIELAKRYGCQVLGIDPAPVHIEQANRKIAEAAIVRSVRVALAGIEAIPADDGAFDYVWCRDVLNHVDLGRGLGECARVLKLGGKMLVYQTFATDLLEPHEAARIYTAMAIHPENMAETTLIEQARNAGLQVVQRDVIGTEWRERWAEEGSTALLEDLLRIARMRRREAEIVARFGRERYEAAYCGYQWGIYQMLGKLQPTVYVLSRPAS